MQTNDKDVINFKEDLTMQKLEDMISYCKLGIVICLTLAGCNEGFSIPTFIVLGTIACIITGFMMSLYRAKNYYYTHFH